MSVNTHWSITGLTPILGSDLVCSIAFVYTVTDGETTHRKPGTWSIPVGDMDGDGNITFPADYIPYTQLTEAQVLEWLFSTFEPGFKTAVEKAAGEEFDLLKATGSPVLQPPTTPSGIPWAQVVDNIYVEDDAKSETKELYAPPVLPDDL